MFSWEGKEKKNVMGESVFFFDPSKCFLQNGKKTEEDSVIYFFFFFLNHFRYTLLSIFFKPSLFSCVY